MNRTPTQSTEEARRGLVFRRELQIEWGDCDPAGIVFYPRYLAFFDANTAHLFAAAGLPLAELARTYEILGMPLIDVQAKFYAASRFGDCITIESHLAEPGRARLTIEHRILREGQLAVHGRECRVWVRRDPHGSAAMKVRPIPQEVIDRFR